MGVEVQRERERELGASRGACCRVMERRSVYRRTIGPLMCKLIETPPCLTAIAACRLVEGRVQQLFITALLKLGEVRFPAH
jgi:hypothetical protein